MYLKEVHMENFKSFGRKLTVPFTRGFTAITGPNGSGKSNIGDAILFVLGPRSAKAIRAGKLVELIFNGGKDGQAAKECLVSLTFDNTDRLMPLDEDEVVLTRRIRRAAKPDDPDHAYSYFYVNGRSASLKEFGDLLDHARISADGYNIVTQGHVTEVVTMGATQRRRIIEDIAGITEFDKDIDRAEKQRSEVDANLERIQIILDEINRTLRQLKKDRDAALRYRELTTQLKTKKGQFAYQNKLDFERRIAHVQERIEKLEGERAEAVEKVNKLREDERVQVRRLGEIDEEIAETGGEELREVQEKIQALRDERAGVVAEQNHAKDEIEEIDQEVEELSNTLRSIQKEHKSALSAAETHELHAREVGASRDKLQKELDQARETISQSDDTAMGIQKQLAELKKEYESTSNKRHDTQLEVDRLTEKREALDRIIEEVRAKETSSRTDIDEIDWKLDEAKEQSDPKTHKELEKAHVAKKKRQAEITQQLQEFERVADRNRNRVAQLRAMKDAAEGVERAYSRAVDAVLQARDDGKLKGVCGTIAELANVDPKYTVAVETAAGARTQSIVVETAKDAQAAIEYLRTNRLGRATFLPLDKMTRNMPRGKSLMVVKDPASHGFVVDLVEFSDRYANAFNYVFGDTVVVGKLDDARRLMGGARLVTMQGDLIEASGAMTGGDSGKKGKKGGMFGGVDPAELEKAQSELRAAETHIETLTDEFASIRTEVQELEDQLRNLKADATTITDRITALEKTREEAGKAHEAAREALHKKTTEADGLDQEIEKLEDVVAKWNDTLADMDAKRESLSQAMLAGTRKDLAKRIRDLEKELDEAREAAREAEKERTIAAETAKLVIARVTEYEDNIKRLRQEQTEHKEAIGTLGAKIKELDGTITALEVETRESNAAVNALHEEKDKVKDALRDLTTKIERHANQAETGYKLIQREKDSLPNLEEGLGEALIELKEAEYTHDDDVELPPMDTLRRDIHVINRDIDALGPINQRALEDYEQEEERRGELDEQVVRLSEERKALTELVEEISLRKKTEFMTVFDAINENYKMVFPKLSLGGSAYLQLENPEDPFDGGLTMMARPKGKKVLRIDAISGGEKSLAALAFIFAIQEHEPSPFYYLDEVDQNLDGVNSDKIGRMVKENSNKAQFIVVSLRKITLKQADHIYGVTMQKIGLSEMIGNFDINRVDEEGNLVKGGKGNKGGTGTKGATPAPSDGSRQQVPMETLAANTAANGNGTTLVQASKDSAQATMDAADDAKEAETSDEADEETIVAEEAT